ncbi:MAG: M23 family metallopeptidase [Actinobacteria bacterium]|nr:M23 family metallopeptidase [Actinomycetota bacterium]
MATARTALRPRTSVAVLAALLALLGAFVVAPASRADDINDKVNAAEDDLADANKAVAKANAALEAARTQLPAARSALADARSQLRQAKKAEAAAAAAAEQATAAALAAEQRVQEAQDRIVDMNGQISDLARAVYTQGPYAELAAILSARTPSDFADQLEAVRSVSRSQNKALSEMQAAKAELALAQAQAEQALVRAEAKRKEAQKAVDSAAEITARAKAAKAKVDALVAARANALAVADNQRDKVKAQYAELKKEQARIRAAAQAAANGGGGRFTGVPSDNLIWPIPGATTSGQVGWRIHPVYGYRSCHTGIDLSGSYGTPIRAAANGRVVLLENGGAYGLHMVIDHGGNLSTMYAHMSSVAVGGGSTVSQGQVIGYVGSTGFSSGPHLHFEVHVGGVPYNPLGWFGGSKTVISCYNQV